MLLLYIIIGFHGEISAQPANSECEYYFFAGASYKTDSVHSLFTGTFIQSMEKMVGDRFMVIQGIHFSTMIRNAIWSIFHAQKPIPKGSSHPFISQSLKQVWSEEGARFREIHLISSSSGSVIAAQTALILARNREAFGLADIYLYLGYSPINKSSKLYLLLLQEKEKGNITRLIYDELQGENDNVTGMAGRTRREALFNSFKILFAMTPDPSFRPPLINGNPAHGHPHHVMAASKQKAYHYMKVISNIIQSIYLAGTINKNIELAQP